MSAPYELPDADQQARNAVNDGKPKPNNAPGGGFNPLALLLLGSSFLGGAMNNRAQTQTTTPTTPAGYRGIEDLLRQSITARLSAPSVLPAGYAETQTKDINKVFDLVSQRTANDVTARGLGTSPVAAAVEGNNQNARGGAIAEMLSRIPALEHDLRTQDLGLAGNALNAARGQTTTAPGNTLGGGLSSMASMLGYMIASGRLNATNNAVNGGQIANIPTTGLPSWTRGPIL